MSESPESSPPVLDLPSARLLARALSWTGQIPRLYKDNPGEGTAHIHDRADWDQLITLGFAVETTDPNRPITRQTSVTFEVTPAGREAVRALMTGLMEAHPMDWNRRFWGTLPAGTL